MSSKNNFITFATQNISNNLAKLDSTLEAIIKNNQTKNFSTQHISNKETCADSQIMIPKFNGIRNFNQNSKLNLVTENN